MWEDRNGEGRLRLLREENEWKNSGPKEEGNKKRCEKKKNVRAEKGENEKSEKEEKKKSA